MPISPPIHAPVTVRLESTTLHELCANAASRFNAACEAALCLRIAILTPRRIERLGGGDWKQAERTVVAMKNIGIHVDHVLIDDDMEPDISKYDIVHFMPFRGSDPFRPWPINTTPPLVAASSVYWDSWRHRWIEQLGLGNKLSSIIRYWGCILGRIAYSTRFPKGAIERRINQRINRFSGCDIILPNTVAELDGLHRHFKLSKAASVSPIPNGVDAPPEWAWRSERPASAPESDYILCPGVFAPRKNQLGLIHATKNGVIPILFMGGPIDTPAAQQYYEACRLAAKPHHIFLGKVEHRSELFYALMRYARVCCLASSCETPGIAALESAMMGARIAITREGGAEEYFGDSAVYFSPISAASSRSALEEAWGMGRDESQKERILALFSWDTTAQCTVLAYLAHLDGANAARFPRT